MDVIKPILGLQVCERNMKIFRGKKALQLIKYNKELTLEKRPCLSWCNMRNGPDYCVEKPVAYSYMVIVEDHKAITAENFGDLVHRVINVYSK